MYDISKPVITGEFSGVAMPVSLSLTLNGAVVAAEVSGNEFTYTPADALDDGEYTLVAEATDANGKTAEATAIFSIRLPVPTVAVESPEAGQVYDHGKPVITGTLSGAAPIAIALSIDGEAVEADVNDNNQFTYTPAEALSVITGTFSGAAPIAVALSIDGKAVEAEVNDNNQFTYTPAEALSDGEHMIAVMVTDANGRTAETSAVFTSHRC
jgi:hypothetical protein